MIMYVFNQTLKQHSEATHKQGVHKISAGEWGEIYGKPMPLYTPLSCIFTYVWVGTLSVRFPKTEARLNISRAQMGAKGSEWERKSEKSARKGQKEKLWERLKENKVRVERQTHGHYPRAQILHPCMYVCNRYSPPAAWLQAGACLLKYTC